LGFGGAGRTPPTKISKGPPPPPLGKEPIRAVQELLNPVCHQHFFKKAVTVKQ